MGTMAQAGRPVADDLVDVLTGFFRAGRTGDQSIVNDMRREDWEEVAQWLLLSTRRRVAEGLLRCVDADTLEAVAAGQVDVPALIARVRQG